MSEKKRIKLPPWLAGLAAVGLWFVIAAGTAVMLKGGGEVIGEKQEIVPKLTPSVAPELDIEHIKSSLAYTDISELATDDSLLISGTENAPNAKLQPVYNAVFSKNGIQIASLADSKLKCRSEAIVPLSEMLDAFYSETQLRTLMINAAYEPYSAQKEKETEKTEGETTAAPAPKCAEHNGGYSFDFGVYIKEDDSRREFTLEGQYSWFSKHSCEYGFIQRYPHGAEAVTGMAGNDSHFRYVGKVAAKILNENSLCLEKLGEFMQQHTIDDPLIVDGSTAVYLYNFEDSKKELPVPVSKSGEPVPCEVYYTDKSKKTVIVAAKPTPEFYVTPKGEPAAADGENGTNTNER